MKKGFFICLFVIIIAFLLSISYVVPIRENYLQIKFDLLNDNKPVKSNEEISKILDSLPNVKYDELNSEYKSKSKSDETKYKNLLKAKNYKKISTDDFFKKLVGNFRIKDFVCKDSFYTNSIKNSKNEFIWLIDEKLPKAILKLQLELEKEGYDPEGFKITYGHRSPSKNEQVGGAKSSKHLLGQAIDLVVLDVNQDGKYTEQDKSIILELAENKVIKDLGGIGRYPGTRTVHLDVRGHKARWDSF